MKTATDPRPATAAHGGMPRPRIMGILNVTPDSFSDGGRWATEEAISRQAEQMLADGADIIDIGGESTRPFAPPVTADQELARVLPAIRAVRRLHASIPISIDTTKAVVAGKALAAGADMINDISALSLDPAMVELAAQGDWPVIIMHMQGTPENMQLNPRYDDVVSDIKDLLANRIAELVAAGIARPRLIIDPGIGFGKTMTHNLEIIRRLAEFRTLNQPVLVGHSRKSFIGKLLGGLPVTQRDLPSAVISALCVLQGADILRVHDVKATAQAIGITLACRPTRPPLTTSVAR